MFIRGMYSGLYFFFKERDKNNPLAVRRNMREPVVEFVVGYLFLSAAVGFHSPDLHRAGAYGIEINIFPVRGIFRTIIKTRGISETCFRSAGGRNFIYIKFPVSFAAEYKCFSIG